MAEKEDAARAAADAALLAAADCLYDAKEFADALQILLLLLERGATRPAVLEKLIDCARATDTLQACGDILAELAAKHPDATDLLNYAAGLMGTLERKRESILFSRMAAASKPLFLSSKKKARLRMLVLQCAATGDYRYSVKSKRFFMPGISDLYMLLDPDIACDRLIVDDLPAAMAALASYPPCDLVFNAISDPDYAQALDHAAILCDMAKLPVCNPPRQVRALNRESLPSLVGGCAGVTAAKSLFLPPDLSTDADILEAVRREGFSFPVIVRAPGFQGGKHMKLLREPGESGQGIYRGNGLHVIEFMDVAFWDDRAPDTPLYPKYRAFHVNGELYPMHLFVADQYEVHKSTSDPVQARHPWLLDLESAFLQNPDRHLPDGLWRRLKAALASFGLDYVGVDFAVSARPGAERELVLFECNPSMRNWLTLLPEGDRVQRQWREVTLAAHFALCRKAGRPDWDFVLKKGR